MPKGSGSFVIFSTWLGSSAYSLDFWRPCIPELILCHVMPKVGLRSYQYYLTKYLKGLFVAFMKCYGQ